MKIGVVDLFCGIGGLSYGFKNEGFDVLAGIDSDSSCKYAYETNLKATFLPTDIKQISGKKISELFSKKKTSYRVLVGCAPCTPFSSYVERYRKKKKSRDHRWHLLKEFGRLVVETKPDVVSMENVPQLARHDVFNNFVRDLKKAGYTVSCQRVRADHYGVPQRRVRLVLIASLWGEVCLPEGNYVETPRTVRDAIGHLPKIKAGVPCKKDRLHVTRNLTPKNLERLKSTTEGGSWKDWDEELQLKCHKKTKGKSFRSVYGRMRWDFPSPVITTQCLGIGNGRFGHPEQNRAISVREAAQLQSFPKKFKLIPPKAPVNGVHLARHIGNAVPVKLGQAIARTIKAHLKKVAKSV